MMLVGGGPPIVKPVEQAPHSVTRPIVCNQFMETVSLLATAIISTIQSMRAEQWRKDSLGRRAWIQT
jgi:hypothetical protein